RRHNSVQESIVSSPRRPGPRDASAFLRSGGSSGTIASRIPRRSRFFNDS
ncbi:hypothetical protein A2U01_0106634, partial [Trifolium medium]|nr:hypothetical protein [Trifolium medium]